MLQYSREYSILRQENSCDLNQEHAVDTFEAPEAKYKNITESFWLF